jgi:hypothetical protein
MLHHRIASLFRKVCIGIAATTLLASCSGGSGTVALTPPHFLTAPPIKHVFTIILENQAYDNTFGPQMPVPYLTQTVAAQGASVPNYYGTSHFSLGNYISLVSGQAVTTANQDDCTNFGGGLGSNYVDVASTGVGANGQVAGIGCVYPAATLTIADQLTGAGLTWKGYMEDMGNDPTREAATCGQPIAGEGRSRTSTPRATIRSCISTRYWTRAPVRATSFRSMRTRCPSTSHRSRRRRTTRSSRRTSATTVTTCRANRRAARRRT